MATAAARRKYNTPGVVNGSLAYDFETLERRLEDTGYMEPDRLTRPMEETPADVIAHAHESAKAKVRTAQRVSPAMVLGFAAAAVMLVMLPPAWWKNRPSWRHFRPSRLPSLPSTSAPLT